MAGGRLIRPTATAAKHHTKSEAECDHQQQDAQTHGTPVPAIQMHTLQKPATPTVLSLSNLGCEDCECIL